MNKKERKINKINEKIGEVEIPNSTSKMEAFESVWRSVVG